MHGLQVRNLSAELSQVKSTKGSKVAMPRVPEAAAPSPVACPAPTEVPMAPQ